MASSAPMAPSAPVAPTALLLLYHSLSLCTCNQKQLLLKTNKTIIAIRKIFNLKGRKEGRQASLIRLYLYLCLNIYIYIYIHCEYAHLITAS